jgi:hypothetical protein
MQYFDFLRCRKALAPFLAIDIAGQWIARRLAKRDSRAPFAKS